jgi:hypothetical protein
MAKSVRDLCLFSRHHLTSDPPFSHLNLETAHRFEEEAALCEERSNISQKNMLKRPNGSGSGWG